MSLQRTPPSSITSSESDIAKLLHNDNDIDILKRPKRLRLDTDSYEDSFNTFKDEMRHLINKFLEDQMCRMSTLDKKINNVITHTKEIQQFNVEIDKSLNRVSEQINEFQSKISHLENEFSDVKTKINAIQDRMESFTKKTNIEIRGIPNTTKGKETKMDLIKILDKVMSKLDPSIEITGLIRDIYRLPNYNMSTKTTIIVELTNTLAKQNILDAVKKYKSNNSSSHLNTCDLGLDLPKSQVYITDNLTSKAKNLFFLARNFSKTNNYAFCWTSGGKVFIRKEAGAPHIWIKSENFLSALNKNAI